jgi:ribosomal-protein-alanine N-acetyltransferase
MQIIAQTPRFVIRNFLPEEEEIFLSLFNDNRVTLHLPKRNRKENIEIFRCALNDYAENKSLGRWGIFNNTDGEYIGQCLLRSFADQPGKIELGYVLHQKYWSQGIASEMAIIMIGYAFTRTDTPEIVGVTTLGNIGSQKVLEKAGMTRMENFRRDGQVLAYFRITR